jgi:pimeloyl-ACP methyl ester carboxylesterase
VAAGSPGVRLDIIPGTTHFLPIERPDIVATTLRDAVADNPEA